MLIEQCNECDVMLHKTQHGVFEEMIYKYRIIDLFEKSSQLPLKLKHELVGGHPSKLQLVPLHVTKV